MIVPDCSSCGAPCDMAKGRTSNGAWQVFWWCLECESRAGSDCIPHRAVPDIAALPVVWDNLDDEREDACEACWRIALVQEHHWAPRHLFGAEADFWPTALLCDICHKRWHDIVTPTMSLSKPGPGRPLSAIAEIVASLDPSSPTRYMLEKAEELSARARGRTFPFERWKEHADRKRARLERKGEPVA